MDFDALAQTVPGINEQAASQQKAARDILLQRQIGALPTQQAEAKASQQLAGAMTQQAGQDAGALQQAQVQTAAQAQQISNAALQNQASAQLAQRKLTQTKALADLSSLKQDEMANAMLQSRKRVMDQEIQAADALQTFGIDQDNSLQMATIQQRKDLQRLGSDVKDKLVDSRLRFEKDEMGRKFTNERQLSDYILSNARTQQEFDSEMRALTKETDQYILTLDMMENKISQALKQGYIKEKGDMDRALGLELARMKQELEKKKQKEMAKKRNNMAAWQAAGTIAGAVAGAIVTGGNPAGAAVGAQIGGAAGTAAGASTI
jgi:hypothetical protein